MSLKHNINFLLTYVMICFNAGICEESGIDSSHFPYADKPIVSEVKILIKEVAGMEPKTAEMAGKIIFLKEGMPFSSIKLEQSIEALKTSGKFSEINTDSEEMGEGIKIIFNLVPAACIRDIKVTGGYPMFESEILNIMTVFPGGVYNERKVEEQKELISALYKRNGFPGPEVSLTARRVLNENYYTLFVKITRGASRKPGKIRIEGNTFFSTLRLKYSMKTWRRKVVTAGMGRFTRDMLEVDVKKLSAMYRQAGFADAVIDRELLYKNDSMLVEIKLKIKEGPRYKIKFAGYDKIAKRKLKKDISIYKQGNLNNSGLLKSKRKMLNRYKEQGFLNAVINTSDSMIKNNKIKMVTFHIKEEKQCFVRSFGFNGGEGLNIEALNDQVLTSVKKPYAADVLEEDVHAVLSVCIQAGYPDCDVKSDINFSDSGDQADILINIRKNSFKRLGNIHVQGIDSIMTPQAVKKNVKASKGGPYREGVLVSDMENLSAVISEMGYPHVSIEMDTLSGNGNREIDVVYKVNPGIKVTMGEFYFSGNFRTRERYLKNEVDLKTGEPFSLMELLQGQKQIQDHAVFRSVYFRPIGFKEQSDQVHLFIEVEEKKPGYLQLGGGYESEKGFFTQTKYGNRNLFGTNKHAWVGGEYSQIGYRTETGITEPRLLRTGIEATFNVYYEDKQDHNITFGVKKFGSSLGFNRSWFEKYISGLTFSYERKDVYGEVNLDIASDTAAVLAATKPRNTLVVTPSLIYDTRNSFIRPSKGLYSSISLNFSSGIKNEQDDFIKYEYELRRYVAILSPLTITAAGRFGFIHTRHAALPVSEDLFFFLGGTNSVRGFSENTLNINSAGDPAGNVRAVSLNSELRWDVGMNFELCGFYDIGQLHRALTTNFTDNYRMSAGGGIRYITPIGPIGILYGHKLQRKAGESPGQFHFSLGYTF